MSWLLRRILIGFLAASLLMSVVAAIFAIRAMAGDIAPVHIVGVGDYELATSGGRFGLLQWGSQVTHSSGPPLVVVAVVLAMPAALVFAISYRHRSPPPAGMCPKCGYDLRAT